MERSQGKGRPAEIRQRQMIEQPLIDYNMQEPKKRRGLLERGIKRRCEIRLQEPKIRILEPQDFSKFLFDAN